MLFRSILRVFLQGMSPEERQVLVRSQSILQRHKEISQMFVDGLVGKKFSRALSFYLDRSEEYLRRIERLTGASERAFWSGVSGHKMDSPNRERPLGALSR